MSLHALWPLLILVAAVVLVRLRHELSDGLRALWRYCTAPTDMKGRYCTDRGWFSSHTKVMHPSGRASRLHRGPRARHAAVRTGTLVLPLTTVYGLLAAFTLTVWVLGTLTAAAVTLGVLRAVTVARTWKHDRHLVQPTRQLMTAKVGHEPASVQIERDGARVKAVELTWPAEAEITSADAPLILEGLERLAIEAPEPAASNFKGRNRVIRYTESEPPPGKPQFTALIPAVKAAKATTLIAGPGRRGSVVDFDLDSEACHVALSVGPGGGKTYTSRWFAIQVLWRGGLVVVLNLKQSGYNWVRGLPSAAHVWELEHIAEMVLWLSGERQRREQIALTQGDIEDQLPGNVRLGPRIWVVFEEQNLTMPKLRRYSKEVYEAASDLIFAGRASLMNVEAVAQRYSAAAAGGGDVRASVNARLMGRYDKKAWKMLADEFPMPAMNPAPGRLQVVTDCVREAQVPKVSGAEAHEFALSGTVALPRSDMPFRWAGNCPWCGVLHGTVTPSQLVTTGSDLLPSRASDLPVIPPPRRKIRLSDASNQGVIDLSYAAARQRRARARKGIGDFPEADENGLHFEDELIAWNERRQDS